MRKRGRGVLNEREERATKITHIDEDRRTMEAARSILFARLGKQRAVKTGRWTREELYADGA